MQTLALKSVGILVAVITIFMAGWTTCRWRYESTYKNQYLALIKQVNEAGRLEQEAKQQMQEKLNQYQRKSENENIKKEADSHSVYDECAITDDGLRIINSAIVSANKITASS